MRLVLLEWRGSIPHDGNPKLRTSEELSLQEALHDAKLLVESSVLDSKVTRFTLEMIRSVAETDL